MILDHLNDKPRLNHIGDGNHPNHPHTLPDAAQPGGGSGTMGGGARPGEFYGGDPYRAQGGGDWGAQTDVFGRQTGGQTYGGGRVNVDKAALGQAYGDMSGAFPGSGTSAKGGPPITSPMAPTTRIEGGYYGPGGGFTPGMPRDPESMRAHALEESRSPFQTMEYQKQFHEGRAMPNPYIDQIQQESQFMPDTGGRIAEIGYLKGKGELPPNATPQQEAMALEDFYERRAAFDEGLGFDIGARRAFKAGALSEYDLRMQDRGSYQQRLAEERRASEARMAAPGLREQAGMHQEDPAAYGTAFGTPVGQPGVDPDKAAEFAAQAGVGQQGAEITHEQYREGRPYSLAEQRDMTLEQEGQFLDSGSMQSQRDREAYLDRRNRYRNKDMNPKEMYEFKQSGEYDDMIMEQRMANRRERRQSAPELRDAAGMGQEMFDTGGVAYDRPTGRTTPAPIEGQAITDPNINYAYDTDSGRPFDPENPEYGTIRSRGPHGRAQWVYKRGEGEHEGYWRDMEDERFEGGLGDLATKPFELSPAGLAYKGIKGGLQQVFGEGGSLEEKYGVDRGKTPVPPWEDKGLVRDSRTEPTAEEVRMAGGDWDLARQQKIEQLRGGDEAGYGMDDVYGGEPESTIGPKMPTGADTTVSDSIAGGMSAVEDTIDAMFSQATGSGYKTPEGATLQGLTTGGNLASAVSDGSFDLTNPGNWEAIRSQAQTGITLPPGYAMDDNGNIQFSDLMGGERLPADAERKLMAAVEGQKQAEMILKEATKGRVANEEMLAEIGAETQAQKDLLAEKEKYEIAGDIRDEQRSFLDWQRKEGSAVMADMRARTIQKDRLDTEKAIANLRESGETTRLAAKIRADMAQQGIQLTYEHANAKAERLLQTSMQRAQHANDLKLLVTKGIDERVAIRLQGDINRRMTVLQENGDTNRLAMQIRSQEGMAGREMSMEMAMASAERQLRQNLQDDQINSQIDMLGMQGDQELSAIRAKGMEERQALAMQLSYQDSLQGQEHSHEYYQAMASRQHDQMMQTEQGRQELRRIKETGGEQRQSMERAFEIGGREMQREEEAERARRQELMMGLDADGSPEQNQAVTQAREASVAFTTSINTALKTATETGDFEALNSAIASELPPLPSGIVWDRASGAFQQREGFEGREIDPAVQRFMSATSSAFRARDRAEQVSQKATEIQTAALLERQKQQQADADFKQAMLTNEIDSAEEALARQTMAETAAIASKTKLEHLNMLLNIMQNPVQLGMAKRHGLLGQIETTLGFSMSNVPEAPADPLDGINADSYPGLPDEEKAFRIAAYVEQGGSPDEFMRMIAASAPAQLQRTMTLTM